MTAYLELKTKGGGRAIIEAGSIVGVITCEGRNTFDISSEKEPLSLILRGGESFMVVGTSPALILARSKVARKHVRDSGADIYIDFLEKADGPSG